MSRRKNVCSVGSPKMDTVVVPVGTGSGQDSQMKKMVVSDRNVFQITKKERFFFGINLSQIIWVLNHLLTVLFRFKDITTYTLASHNNGESMLWLAGVTPYFKVFTCRRTQTSPQWGGGPSVLCVPGPPHTCLGASQTLAPWPAWWYGWHTAHGRWRPGSKGPGCFWTFHQERSKKNKDNNKVNYTGRYCKSVAFLLIQNNKKYFRAFALTEIEEW